MSNKLTAGAAFPLTELPKIGGGALTLGGKKDRWTLLIIYRGKHCPRCKKYLNQLQQMLPAWDEAQFDVAVISADVEAKAAADQAEFGWTFDLGYGLTKPQMRAMGLYISEPLSAAEADGLFAEPAMFGITPDGIAQIISINNAPAVRPDLVELLDGMIFTLANNRPVRGMA